MKFNNLTGKVFGKLTVVREAGRNKLKKVLWECQCECGNTTVAVSGSLVTGNTTSCGCIVPGYKHGGTGKGSYNSWRAMVRRCTKPQDKDYVRYGAKGITVCSAWMDYATFAKAMGEPVGDETLDRIDPKGNYEPSNCRWASPTVQARNIKVPKATKSGYIGVINRNEKWFAEITVKKKKYYSKMYTTKEEAVMARKELEQKYWGIQ